MKKIIFFSMIILLVIVSFNQEKKSPIEGAWRLVYAKFGSMKATYPAQLKGGDIKIWTKNHFVSVGRFQVDTTVYNAYVGGKYTLNGNKYVEEVIYHADKGSVGQKVRLLLEMKNDTLIQKYGADENWKLEKDYSVEKYVRAE